MSYSLEEVMEVKALIEEEIKQRGIKSYSRVMMGKDWSFEVVFYDPEEEKLMSTLPTTIRGFKITTRFSIW